MPGYRRERIAEMMHRELAVRLPAAMRDQTLPPVSITHVEVSRDLKSADVHFMPLGGGDVSDGLTDALKQAARALRGPIGRALRLRHAPVINFCADQHTEAAVRVMSILEKLERERDDDQPENG